MTTAGHHRRAGLGHAAVRCGTVVAFGLVPVALVLVAAGLIATAGPHGSDFETFWRSGRAVLHGGSPYPSLGALPQHADRTFAPFVYPPVTAFSMVPLSLLPYSVANVLFLLLNLGSIALALRFLGVADRRCYGLAYASAPVFAAVGLGAVSSLLLLGVAAAWRYRDRAVAAGLLVAYVVTAKLFLWPLWLWLIRTRRFRAAVIAAAAAAAVVVGSWTAIGFAGLADYPRLLNRLTGLVGPHSYSTYALERSLGIGGGTAQATLYVAALAAVIACGLLVADDRRVLAAAVGVALLVTPILWPHYLVLLFVPIALARPSFSPLWVAPLFIWLDSSAWSNGSAARIVGLLALSSAIVGAAMRRRVLRPAGAPAAAGTAVALSVAVAD